MAEKRHRIEPGECISTVADLYRVKVDTLWEAEENEPLRKVRRSGYVLKPGDEVVVVDVEVKTASNRGTGKTHPFQVKGPSEKLRLRLLRGGQPRANEGYTLDIEGRLEDGTTNDGGNLEAWLGTAQREGRLFLDEEEELELDIGGLLPVSEPEGGRQRLVNLGYLEPEGATDEDTGRALRFFQRHHRLEVTGELDAATQDKLVELHGC
jgi:hypothetical protein